MHVSPRPANPSKSGTRVGKIFRSGWPLSLPWAPSIPHAPAPHPGCTSSQRARAEGERTEQRLQRGKGILPRTFCSLFFFPLNVEKLNACFEFLIRLSSFCHLFCFVMHYIQLHISNPQILPRHQNTCQAFTFRSRRIKGLSRLAHTAERRDALASPTAVMLRSRNSQPERLSWKPPPPKDRHSRGRCPISCLA